MHREPGEGAGFVGEGALGLGFVGGVEDGLETGAGPEAGGDEVAAEEEGARGGVGDGEGACGGVQLFDAAFGGGAGAATPGSQQDFTVNVGDRIFFDTDSTSIRADAAATLDRQAQWLQRYPNYAITVEGHADERGTREYNIALSARRATAAREFLIAQGVKGSRISSIVRPE